MKKEFTHIIVLALLVCCVQQAYNQAIELKLSPAKDCGDHTYCVGIQLKAGSPAGFNIGTSSLLLIYDEKALAFKSYVSQHFDGSDLCAGGAASGWTMHQYDAYSRAGEFELTMTLADDSHSCPEITEAATIDIGIVCFDILRQGAAPGITFDLANSQFNLAQPDDGTATVSISSVDSLFSSNDLACDCPGQGVACDDNNVYTVNDEFDQDCKCRGEYLDTDEDTVPDGIDPCLDQNYEAELALFSGPLVRTSYPQYSGLSYLDYQNNSGDYIEFTVNAVEEGDHMLAFRYSLVSGNRPLQVKIDGAVVIQSLNFPSTDSWSNWDTVTTQYYLQPGTHTIRLTAIGSNGANLDQLILSHCTGCTESGKPCDDGDLCTTDDVYDANCNCGGKYLDTDEDGVCNTSDVCEGGNDHEDYDGDGAPDFCDACDNGLIGIPCDDGNPCTVNDAFDANCNCTGIFTGADSDNDGVCDDYDLCPGNDDSADADGDNIADGCDPCDNRNIGKPCNDGNPCTVLDVYAADCSCKGFLLDTDEDGVCDALDQCPGQDDNLDTDGDGKPDFCDPNVAVTSRMEIGYLSGVGESWQTVMLDNSYNSMVVVATPVLPSSKLKPAVARIRNAAGNTFEIKVQNPGGSTEDVYAVHYLVLEEGVYTQQEDGITMEAMKVQSPLTAGLFNWNNREPRSYQNSYTNPVVLGQVMTENDTNWSVFWASRSNSSSTPPNSTSFAAGKHIGQDTLTDRAEETIGIIVLEAGNHALDGLKLEAGVGPDIVGGTESSTTGYVYNLNLANVGRTVLSAAGMDGSDGGWPVLFGTNPVRLSSVTLAFDEDQIADSERSHTSEEVAYAAFEFTYPLSILASATDAACHGAAEGSAQVSVTGGFAPYNYMWSNGETTAAISNLPAGEYSVTVSDDIGTTYTAIVAVSEPSQLNISTNTTDVTCFGSNDGTASATALGGTGTPAFFWTNGETDDEISALAAGPYGVVATDENGCTASAIIIISEPPLLTTGVTGTGISCHGGSDGTATASLSGGTGGISLLWSNGQTGETISNVPAGTYSVTATDANGCTASAEIFLDEPDALAVAISSTDASCFGANDGAAVANFTGGTGAVSYLWSNGQSGETISGLVAGDYEVTATDANGCTAVSSVTVSEPEALALQTSGTDVSCNGDSNGTATASFTGGTGIANFTWSNGESGETATGLPPGSYEVTATDANGCTAIASVNISEPALLSVEIEATDISCNGENNGTATASFTGGNGNVSYAWSNGDSGETVSNLPPGNYEITATDENGCTATASATIAEPDVLEVEISGTDVTCNGLNNGAATASFIGGTGSIAYEWSNGASDEMNINLPAGTYEVTATDANGCTAAASLEISEPGPLTITIDSVSAETHTDMNGLVSVTIAGGVGAPYVFQWYYNGLVFSENEDLSGLGAGEYILQVQDANGCSVSDTILVENLTAITVAGFDARIALHPNPTAGLFTVNLGLPQPAEVCVSVVDVTGRTVLPEKREIFGEKALQFNLSNVPSGIYFLRIGIDGQIAAMRIIVSR